MQKNVEEEEKNKQLIEEWKKANGITEPKAEHAPETWTDVVKSILVKPYIYVVGCLLVISPYGVEIVKLLIDHFGK